MGVARIAAAGPAGAVAIEGVSKRFGAVTAVAPTSLEVPAGALMTLLGPSGSGKTTLLKIIAGFEAPTTGRVTIAGADITRTPPHKRNLGFVFQQYALFPHLTVAQNIAYPLEMRGLGRAETAARVAEAIALIRLDGLERRRPSELSGGQQQRVALARAIVFRPPVLLMDEPMAALDKRLREEMQHEIRGLQRRLGITTVAVTHDQTEALVMSDLIAVLNRGQVEQVGPPREVYDRPRTEFVATFVGESNLFRGAVEGDAGGAVMRCPGELSIRLPRRPATPAASAVYAIRPEAISLGSDPAPDAVNLEGEVKEAVFAGDALRVRVETAAGLAVLAKTLPRHARALPPAGAKLTLSWRPEDGAILDG